MKAQEFRELLDQQAESVMTVLAEEMQAYEKLIFLTAYLLRTVEREIRPEMMEEILGEEPVLRLSGGYFQNAVRQLIETGQEREEFIRLRTAKELTGLYLMLFRGSLEEWTGEQGGYELESIGRDRIEFLLQSFVYPC